MNPIARLFLCTSLLTSGIVFLSEAAVAQEVSSPVSGKDSTEVYLRIEDFSKQRKFTRLVYPLFFRQVQHTRTSSKQRTAENQNEQCFSQLQGRIIRNINVVTLYPFGFKASDSSRKPHDFFSNAGNKLHVKTLPFAVRNYLLIRHNEPFDSLLVIESERLVRSQRFVRDVALTAVLTESDSVDIVIRELDVWSVFPDGSVSGSHMDMKLTEQNFFGTGQQFQDTYSWNYSNGKAANEAAYNIPNINNTFINTTLLYYLAEDKSFIKRLTIDRPFYSSFTRMAGGIMLEQQMRMDSIPSSNSRFVTRNFRFNTFDYWAGSSWQIFKGLTEYERTTNLFLTARRLSVRYLEKPSEIYDTLRIFSNETSYYFGAGINSRKYVQDKFIFRYDVKEDIPIGRTFEITGGYRNKNAGKLFYAGTNMSLADYYSWGYLGTNLETGTFFDAHGVTQGVIRGDLTYFTRLMQVGNWKFRQFVKSQLTIGTDRLPSDKLTINDDFGFRGFNSEELNGTRRFLLVVQTQSYAPWDLLGFRFGPFMKYSMAKLGDESSGFRKSSLYSQFGLGVLIRNDFLNANYFQISLAFYPMIPGTGNNIFKTNAVKTTDIGFSNFEIGKPANIIFQ